MQNNTKNITLCSILIALAFCFSYIESFIPINLIVPIPGIKLGVANIITLFCLKNFSFKFSFFVVFIRAILQNILFGSPSAFLFSICGGLFALIIMYFLLKSEDKYFSIIGVSIAGASCHNIGQIMIAIIYFKSISFMFYLPILLLLSIPTGFLTGFITHITLNHIKKIKYN